MPADPARAQEVFLAATERTDPTDRSAYLDQACAGDAALRARVQALLIAHDQPDSLLDAPLAASADPAATQAFPPAGAGSGDRPRGTQGEDVDNELTDALGGLAPTGRPDSLGRIGHYEVLEILGRGGFGVVFRAFDEVLQRVVAVKLLAPSLAVTSPARKRFLREARASAPIQHENVVRVYEVGEQPLPYLVMEFIPGETLQQTLDRTGPLDVAAVVRIGRQIALGLAAAHEQGLIHRDIKPSNILIDNGPRQHVKITDFGLARAADDASLTRSGVVAGTPMYMAPEQARGESLDHRADLFSLGSVLYTMLTGHPPFRAESTLAVLKRVAEDTPRPIREVIPEVPAGLCRIVEKLHAKDPAARYQTAAEVADVLADCEQQLKTGGRVEELAPAAPRPRRRRRLAAVALTLLVLLAGGLGLTEATGVTDLKGTVVRLFTPSGTLVVEVDDPQVKVTIDGEDVVIHEAETQEVRLKAGTYKLRAVKDGQAVREELVTITRGGKQVVAIHWEPRRSADAEGWLPLFNGKDLTGWVPRHAAPGAWKVEDGVMVGRGEQYGELVTERGTFQDYELRLEARINAGGDSGVFNRVNLDQGGSGYEVQIGCREAPRPHTGAVLVKHREDERPNQHDARARLTRPGEWFTLHITLRDNRIVTTVNGTTTVDYVDPGRRCQQGHIILQLLKDTVVEFRKIEIKELPKTAVTELLFVLLTDGGEERAYATLSEAVAGASDGDTIEVRGNGPFVTGPVDLGKLSLTLRAGSGARPVLRLSPEAGNVILLRARGPLVLEGLELQGLGGDAPAKRSEESRALVDGGDHPLFVANCRFLMRSCWGAIYAREATTLEVRNCEFVGVDYNTGVEWGPSQEGKATVENCVMIGGAHGCVLYLGREGDVAKASVRLANNTLALLDNIAFYTDVLPKRARYIVDLERNVFDGSRSGLYFMYWPALVKGQNLAAAEAEAALSRAFSWRERGNLYSSEMALLNLNTAKSGMRSGSPKNLEDWKRFWKFDDASLLRGRVHYQGGDLRARAAMTPQQLKAADFRLRKGSLGKDAAEGGKDLGADVDLVGPGAAYERWKKSPEYRQWLKATGK